MTKRRYNDDPEGPPPMDESWWEAVLAEDEAQGSGRPVKNTRHVAPIDHDDVAALEQSMSVNLDWRRATELYEQDQVVTLNVTGCNRGGLLVQGHRLQGFVPVSHLIEVPCNEADVEAWLEKYVDTTLCLKVIECDQERGRVVFSERAAQSRPGSRKHLLTTLRPGGCVSGVVTNITDFGVFVDLGGVEGLVHVSEISWGRVHHPADVLELGQRVDVFVIQVDQERARVALSLKRLHSNPWETVEQRYKPGQVAEATITSIVQFGAFARLEEGLDGLIHISEFSRNDGSVNPASLLREGQQVQVRILHVDAPRQRLGLSLKLDNEDE
ncbi:MAG: 30S ribosomal protein S1 [Chloroflexota bacterium]